MTSELVVDVQPKEVSIAVLEDKTLVEFHKEQTGVSFSVGDIFMGRVHKVMPGLNACFVDVGYEKDAFLHYLDLGPQFASQQEYLRQVQSNRKRPVSMSRFRMSPDIPKDGQISGILQPGQEVLVQIAKEPISTKGPRLTSEISIAGRFLILMPFSDKISVSGKIKSPEEKGRLKQLLQSITPKGYGVIVRTVAENKRVAELDNELKVLVKRWEDIVQKLQSSSEKAPRLVYEETSRTVVLLRDILNASYEHIYVNSPAAYQEIKDYVTIIMPEKADIVEEYRQEIPIMDRYAVTKQIKSGFGKVVSIKAGAYLIIEHTEAMHVIDVNSGNRTRSEDQEQNALEVNLSAADEIARQLRLRDMGGIIVVDFIDMADNGNRQKLYERLREDMAGDRAKHNILPLSKFCLMQITRQRVRPSTFVETDETCPTCFGKGTIRPSILFTDALENKIACMVQQMHQKKIRLHVHPYVAAFVEKGGLRSLKWQWRRKYDAGLRIIPSQKMTYLQYAFYDSKGQEIDMKEEIEIKKS